MRKLIATVTLVSLLVLAGCAQAQSSSRTATSAESVSTAETSTAASNPSAVGASASAESASTAETSAPVASASVAEPRNASDSTNEAQTHTSFVIAIGDMRLAVSPADTEAARALMEQLQSGPVTLSLHAYGGFEQVGPLPFSLPANDEQITTSPGDVMLYQGNQITIFTGSNSWAYTPLGTIEGATSETLLEALGGDTVEITLSLA